MRTKSPTRLCVSYLETNSHDILIFFPSSKLWRLKLPINPLQVYAEIPCIWGFHFQGEHSLFLGQAESPAAVRAARLAHTDCYLWEQNCGLHSLCGGDLPPLLQQQLVHLGCAQLLKFSPPLAQPTSVPAHTRREAWVTSVGAAMQVPPQPKQAAGTGPDQTVLSQWLQSWFWQSLKCISFVWRQS